MYYALMESSHFKSPLFIGIGYVIRCSNYRYDVTNYY